MPKIKKISLEVWQYNNLRIRYNMYAAIIYKQSSSLNNCTTKYIKFCNNRLASNTANFYVTELRELVVQGCGNVGE